MVQINSKQYFVTGGTGFLGQHLVSRLVQDGHKVKVLARKKPKEHIEGVVYQEGSILDKGDLQKGIQNCDGVFHLAGIVEHSRKNPEKIYEINVQGTLNVLEAAKRSNVKRIVYSSTSGTVGVLKNPQGKIPDDSSDYAYDITKNWPYYDSKVQAEKKASEMAQQLDLHLIFIRPTLLLGPGDSRLSSCKTVYDILKQKIPLLPNGGLSFVDVRDVAKTMVVAMEKGNARGKYLLSATNQSLSEFFQEVSKYGKVKIPFLKLPQILTYALGSFLYNFKGIIFKKWDESLNPVVLEMSGVYWYCDSSHATQDLNFRPLPKEKTIQDTITWLHNNID